MSSGEHGHGEVPAGPPSGPSGPRIGVARVHGRSMRPTLREGDRLLVRYGAACRPGDVVVCRLPDRTLAVKRATAAVDDGWWVERDNPREGVDSALVGAIPTADVLAVAVLRLWPRPRLLGPGSTPTT